MGASYAMAFYGVRHRITGMAVIEALELENEPRLLAAKKAGLDTWWDNFEGGDAHHLYIGASLGRVGPEQGARFLTLADDALARTIADTDDKLKAADLKGRAQVWLQWAEDF